MASNANLLHALLSRGFEGVLSNNSVEEDNVGIEKQSAKSDAETLHDFLLRYSGDPPSYADVYDTEAGGENQNQICPRVLINGTKTPTPPPHPR
jgi:hypothetical protein